MMGSKVELKSGFGAENQLNNTGQISINTNIYKEFGIETQKPEIHLNDSNREMEMA